ncbi:FMN-binding negative transcriptional regulator [Chitinophaga qingshengii]|uniref:FMN-binding negative transcriptional regulator n=1 Tax=Chitinophaga qingshengii TaxID=1569794 RepID=A0ABR7TRC4_9BACT|nr:FMN-binding negative transcriptional regulator [Chitinophaga qingshengii]MBC9933049.1 FMN-binding negative transcriptional regulator [Chitinophaga qingshengii]
MYVPHQFRFKDNAEMVAFMKKYSFATIVTVKDNIPVATQLPFSIDDSNGKLLLTAHFAAANEQAKYIEGNTSLVIFNEPHAYISPVHYDKKESVPTWNYIAIHAYGKARIVTDEQAVTNVLEQTILFYDAAYMEQWNSLPDKFKKGMIRGIVAFEIAVTDLQGQKKLSQNKTAVEKQRIIAHLEKSENSVETAIADYIREL